MVLSVDALRLFSKEGDRPAALALICTICKRLCNPPGAELASDGAWRVRLPRVARAALGRPVSWCLLGTMVPRSAVRHLRMLQAESSCRGDVRLLAVQPEHAAVVLPEFKGRGQRRSGCFCGCFLEL